jgi:glutathione S-transferase
MSLTLYAHPFSSYCQKVLVALYENDVEFEYRTIEDPSAMAELKARWPFARFPILVDDGHSTWPMAGWSNGSRDATGRPASA